jgi:hypothetical protein
MGGNDIYLKLWLFDIIVEINKLLQICFLLDGSIYCLGLPTVVDFYKHRLGMARRISKFFHFARGGE